MASTDPHHQPKREEASSGSHQARIQDCLTDAQATGRSIDTYAYEIFGINHGCTDEEVKARYRELMKQFHTDVAAVDSSFAAAISTCFYCLETKERRELFDRYIDPVCQMRLRGEVDFKDFCSLIENLKAAGRPMPWEERIKTKDSQVRGAATIESLLSNGAVPVTLPEDPGQYLSAIIAAVEYFESKAGIGSMIYFARHLRQIHPQFAQEVFSGSDVSFIMRGKLKETLDPKTGNLYDAVGVLFTFPLEQNVKERAQDVIAQNVATLLRSGATREVEGALALLTEYNFELRNAPRELQKGLMHLHLHPAVQKASIRKGLQLAISGENPDLLDHIIRTCRLHKGRNEKAWDQAVLAVVRGILRSDREPGDIAAHARGVIIRAYPFYKGARPADDTFIRTKSGQRLLRRHFRELLRADRRDEVAAMSIGLGLTSPEYRNLMQLRGIEVIRYEISRRISPSNAFIRGIRDLIWSPSLYPQNKK